MSPDAAPGATAVPADAPEWEIAFAPASAEETQAIGAALGRELGAGDLVVLTGELGAGKTTFTQGLGEGLGVRPGIISPTFVLVRIHPNLVHGPHPGGPDLVHVDAYRLSGHGEIADLDLENWADTAVTVVEWGRGLIEDLADSRLDIELHRPAAQPASASLTLDFDTEDDDEPRLVLIRAFGPRWAGRTGVAWPAVERVDPTAVERRPSSGEQRSRDAGAESEPEDKGVAE